MINHKNIRKSIITRRRQKIRIDKKHILGAVFLALILGSLSYKLYQLNQSIQPLDLTSIQGSIAQKPTIDIASSGGKIVKIKLKEYPDLDFTLSGIAYSTAKARTFVENVSVNDPIQFKIRTEEYDQKIMQTTSPGFIEKLLDAHSVAVYQISDKNHIYLSVRNYYEAKQWDNNIGIIVLVVGGIIVYFSIWSPIRLPKRASILKNNRNTVTL